MLFLQPLANHLCEGYKSLSKQRPHLVVKRTVKELNQLTEQIFEEEGLLMNRVTDIMQCAHKRKLSFLVHYSFKDVLTPFLLQ